MLLGMHKLNKQKSDQRGAVSFLTVIFLALLLTTITVSFVRLAINEQRQSTDDDLTNRAFYAAESGVEDAKRAIEMFQNNTLADLNGGDCAPPTGFDPDLISDPALDSEYTCQLINMDAPNFQADLDMWEGVTVPLNGANSTWTSVLIEWHLVGTGTGSDGPAPSERSNNNLPRVGDWNSNWAAILRSNFFDIPTSGSISRGNFASRAGFLNSGNSGSSSTTLSSFDRQIINASCDDTTPTNEYACSALITGLTPASREYYLRLQSIYEPTHIQITLQNNSGTQTDFSGVQAVVDVTGRAGDVYRRVEARIQLNQGNYLLPDFALMSATDLCKDFGVTDDPNDFQTLNGAIAGSCTQ